MNGDDICRLVLNYAIKEVTADNQQLFLQKVNQHLAGKLRGEAMTLAECFRQEGRVQGIEQGIEHEKIVIAQRLLAEGVELAFIAKITKLPLAQIKKLKNLVCNSSGGVS